MEKMIFILIALTVVTKKLEAINEKGLNLLLKVLSSTKQCRSIVEVEPENSQ